MCDFIIDNGVLKKYEGSDQNVDIPADVVEIGAKAFSGNDAIVSVNLPAGLKQIKYYAFGDCKNLEKISFPEGLETISSDAFENCKSLKEVILPDSVSFIDRSAFIYCISLEKVVLPSSVKMESFYSSRPADGAFCSCDSLKTAGPLNSGCNIEFGWTDDIPAYAFLGARLSKATIPETIKSIGDFAFYYVVSYLRNKNGEFVPEKSLQITIPNNCKLGKKVFPEGAQIKFIHKVESKDKLDAALIEYVDKDFVKRLSDEELAWITLYQSKKWRTAIHAFLKDDQQIINILNCCCNILQDNKKITKSVGDALAELHSKIKDNELKISSAEELLRFLKDRQ